MSPGFCTKNTFPYASKWDAVLVANMPIFSAGIIEADVRTAWSKASPGGHCFNRIFAGKSTSRLPTRMTISSPRRKKLTDLRTEVQAAADALDQSEQLLKNGFLAIPLDVLTAQQTLLDAQLTYTSETFDVEVFYLDLLRLTGDFNPHTPKPAWLAAAHPANFFHNAFDCKPSRNAISSQSPALILPIHGGSPKSAFHGKIPCIDHINPSMNSRIARFAIRHAMAIIFIVVALCAAGGYAVKHMASAVFPQTDFPPRRHHGFPAASCLPTK